MNASGTSHGLSAPCGRVADEERYEDQDDEVLLTRQAIYSCGCRSIGRVYHDGGVTRTLVRHDGIVLVDESHLAQ
jgi:hypothetical protein